MFGISIRERINRFRLWHVKKKNFTCPYLKLRLVRLKIETKKSRPVLIHLDVGLNQYRHWSQPVLAWVSTSTNISLNHYRHGSQPVSTLVSTSFDMGLNQYRHWSQPVPTLISTSTGNNPVICFEKKIKQNQK
jgi:hypothetical protein